MPVSIARNSHQSQEEEEEEERTVLYFEYASDNINLPKNPLGLIVSRSRDGLLLLMVSSFPMTKLS